jgi:lactoylglutathione lyase
MMNAVTLGYVILYVPNVVKTVEYYERAFGIKRRFIYETGQYAEMETGATALAFADEAGPSSGQVFEKNRPDKKAPGAEVAFIVDDVPKAFARAIKEGAVAVAEPMEKPWGQTVAYVRDLDGFLVELCTVVRG